MTDSSITTPEADVTRREMWSPSQCSRGQREFQFALCAGREARAEPAFVAVELPGELEFAEVGEGVAVLDGHADGLLPGNERHVPRFEPDGAEDVPGQPPLGFGPAPIVNQTPEAVVPGIAGVVGGREVERVVVRSPDGAADDAVRMDRCSSSRPA